MKQIALQHPSIKRVLSERDQAVHELHDAFYGKHILAETEAVAQQLTDAGLQFDAKPTSFNGIDQPSSFGLPELGQKYLPTKREHNYLLRYDHVFGSSRHRVKRMVEIGVQTDTSVRMWRDYFPNAEIIGIDIDPDCKRFENDRIKIAIGDQTDRNFLLQFARENFGTIDVIVDDGLHSPEAIQTSFEFLYPALSAHGIYAVEDLVGHEYVSSWVAAITAAINHWPANTPGKIWQILDDLGPDATWFARHTIGVEFYRYILFVKRGINPRDNPFIMDKAIYYGALNKNLKLVADAKEKLVAQGRKVDAENLIEIVGFQLRPYVYDYLSGVSKFEFDAQAGDYRPIPHT